MPCLACIGHWAKGMGAAMTQIPFDIVGFDLDGTLLDTSGDLAAAVNHALASVDVPPFSVDEIKRFVGRGAKTMLARALAASGHDAEAMLNQIMPTFFAYYADNLSRHTAPYPGLMGAMEELRDSGVRLAICTNKVERFTLPLIEQLGMTHWFASIIGGDTTGVLKPDPAPIHAMIAQAGGGRCVFIGDTINDIAGARNAGVANIAVSFGFIECPPEELEPDAVIDHFDELVPLLRNWPG